MKSKELPKEFSPEDYQELLIARDKEISSLKQQIFEQQNLKAELSARLSYLDEIKEENLRNLIGKSLLKGI